MESQLSSPTSPYADKYKVFLSFRGEDTRKNFVEHLYNALYNAGFHAFRDDHEIQKGQRTETKRERAIKQSSISVIIFSRNYARSNWCLDELLYILERRKFGDCYRVFPTFFDVQPTEVGNQKGSFQKAFDEYEKNGEYSKDKIEKWRNALKEVSKLAGIMLQDEDCNGHEAGFIRKIVNEVGTTLKRKVQSVSSYTVGVQPRVKDIDLWLKDPADVGIGEIIGMGGIGKTTLAKVVYNVNCADFEASSFLADIRKACEQINGLLGLQDQLLSDISKGKRQKISNTDEGLVKIQDAVCGKRILIILDDVDRFEQLDALIGAGDSFLKGSKLIITTRRERLLSHHKHKTFRIKKLDDHEALRLFSLHAFKGDHPIDGYMEHSERVLQHCKGLPLAIEVLGSSLFGRSSESWSSALEKLEAIPDERIRKTLKVSYKSLCDDHEKRLFLMIASTFVGEDVNYAVKILEERGFYSKARMDSLKDRSLITISKDNRIKMHPLVRDMATEIIRQETNDGPGKHNFYNLTGAQSETVTSEGSILSKNDECRKRMRMEDYEDESKPRNEEWPSSFKHMLLGLYSLFGPVTRITRLLTGHYG